VTLDDYLETYRSSAAADRDGVRAPLPGTRLYEALYVYKPDVSIVVAESRLDDEYAWDWVGIYADKRAQKFWVDMLYNGVPVYRQQLVAVDGGRAFLPSPIGYLDNDDPNKGWAVKREEYDMARQFSIIAGRTDDFDEHFGQAEQQAGLTIVDGM
jgi:hypothetical protein